jgi:hypothetical protein
MVFIGLYDEPLPFMKPCPALQLHCCSTKETNMDNTNGNLFTSALEASKPFILKFENLKIFMIIELDCGSHENPSSSNSGMPN